MTEEELMASPLYADVLARPGDDQPREAIADWLDSRNLDRARHLRHQLTYAHLERRSLVEQISDSHSMNPERLSFDEEQALEERWSGPVKSLGWIKEWDFVRGFVGHVSLDPPSFLEHAAELFARFPIRHVSLDGAAAVIDELAACPYLERLVGLSIRWSQLEDRHVATLAASPHIRNLRYLDLFANRIGISGYEALCASPNLPDLLDVTLGNNAAPAPTTKWSHSVDFGHEFYWIDGFPPIGLELERKYGRKRWLRAPALFATYPVTYIAFDSDAPPYPGRDDVRVLQVIGNDSARLVEERDGRLVFEYDVGDGERRLPLSPEETARFLDKGIYFLFWLEGDIRAHPERYTR
jgi:uncharacterized protein (TIGR02996 family)